MRGSEHILLREQGSATVELAIVDQPRHPRVPVNTRGQAAHDAVLLVRPAALCGFESEQLNEPHLTCLVRDIHS